MPLWSTKRRRRTRRCSKSTAKAPPIFPGARSVRVSRCELLIAVRSGAGGNGHQERCHALPNRRLVRALWPVLGHQAREEGVSGRADLDLLRRAGFLQHLRVRPAGPHERPRDGRPQALCVQLPLAALEEERGCGAARVRLQHVRRGRIRPVRCGLRRLCDHQEVVPQQPARLRLLDSGHPDAGIGLVGHVPVQRPIPRTSRGALSSLLARSPSSPVRGSTLS